MIKTKHILIVLILALIIYFSKGSIYPTGSIISRGSLTIIFLISLFYFVKSILIRNKKNSHFFIAWTLFFIINLLGVFFSVKPQDIDIYYGRIINNLMTAFLFYPFYYFSYKNILSVKHLYIFFLIFIPITILNYFWTESQVLSERISGNLDYVNNSSYQFVSLIPFLFFINKKNKIVSYLLFSLLIIFIIEGAKRGAIISGLIGAIHFGYYHFKLGINKKNILKFLQTLLIVSVLFYFLIHLIQSNEFLLIRLESMLEGDSSGRDQIYSSLFYSWVDSANFINILFGYGFAASKSLSLSGHYAHNDWLELLTSYGLIGVLSYLFLFYYGFKMIFNKDITITKKIILSCVMLTWLFISVVSMGYISSDHYFRAIILAYLSGSETSNML